MGIPILRLSNGTTTVSLLGPTGFYLMNWAPAQPNIKQAENQSVFGRGTYVAYRTTDNTIDTLEIGLSHVSEDEAITLCQEADRLLEQAMAYWASRWTSTPVWIEAKGPEETNVRFATIKDFRIAGHSTPYGQPFYGTFIYEGESTLSLVIEHDPWQDTEPGTDVCVSISALQTWEWNELLTVEVGASSDDAYTEDPATIDLVSTDLRFGKSAGGNRYRAGMRFQILRMGYHSNIVEAYISGTAKNNLAGNACHIAIFGEDSTTPATYSTYADFTGRTLTTNYVYWENVPAFNSGDPILTPDISPIIQELIDTGGWAWGGDVAIQFYGMDSCDNNAYRDLASWDDGVFDPPMLVVRWRSRRKSDHHVPTSQWDDIQVTRVAGGYVSNGSTVEIGEDAGDTYEGAFRFASMDIPQGATIARAYMRVRAGGSDVGPVARAAVYGQKSDTAGSVTSYADYISRPRTESMVPWTLPDFTSGYYYETPDLAIIIQEIVNRPGWVSGNSMQLFVQDNGSDVGGHRLFRTVDAVPTEPSILFVEFKQEFGSEATCDDQVFIANAHKYGGQLTHVFVYNASGASFGANLLNLALPYALFPNPVEDNDCIYFGQDDAVVDTGVFNSLVFNIDPAATYVAPATVDWEYWNGAWVALTALYDGTCYTGGGTGQTFSVPGVQSVHWEQPADWAQTTVNTYTGFWVRARATVGAGSITVPEQATRHLYTITNACIDIPATSVSGDLPMLSRIQLRGRSDTDDDWVPAEISRVHVGLRSMERGAEFSAYLPTGGVMAPPGLQVTENIGLVGAGVTYSTDDPTTAYSACALYTTTGASAMQDVLYFDLSNPLAQATVLGTYRVFLRYLRPDGADDDLRMRLRTHSDLVAGAGNATPDFYTNANSAIEVADFGKIRLAPWAMGFPRTDNTVFRIFLQLSCDVAAVRNCYIYDLILLPADEWYACIELDTETATALFDQRTLDIDSARFPKDKLFTVLRGYFSQRIYSQWFRQSAGLNILQPDGAQRLWFFMQQYATSSPPSGELYAQWPLAGSVRLTGLKRYKWARGAE